MTRTVVRGKGLLLSIAFAVFAVVVPAATAANASTVMKTAVPWATADGRVQGKTVRNDSCPGVICTDEWVVLERSSWTGYREIANNRVYPKVGTTVALTQRGCRSGTYDYHTEHVQNLIINQPFSITIKENGVSFSYFRNVGVVVDSLPKRITRNNDKCENGLIK